MLNRIPFSEREQISKLEARMQAGITKLERSQNRNSNHAAVSSSGTQATAPARQAESVKPSIAGPAVSPVEKEARAELGRQARAELDTQSEKTANRLERVDPVETTLLTKSSVRKIEANRRNAKLSTGPRTTRGKRIARQNAVKHGLFAREIVVTEGDGKENVQEFMALMATLKREHNPVGYLEELQVEKIAKAIWRLRRATRYETGSILAKTANVRVDAHLRQSDQLISFRVAPLGFQNDMRQFSLGIKTTIEILDRAEQEIRSHRLSQQQYDLLLAYFGRDIALADYWGALKTRKDSLGDFQENVLEWIAKNRERHAAALQVITEKEELELQAKLACGSLPLDAKKILRYENELDRQIQAALETLAELQKKRRESEDARQDSATSSGGSNRSGGQQAC